MKKLLSITLCLMCSFLLFSCNTTKQNNENSTNTGSEYTSNSSENANDLENTSENDLDSGLEINEEDNTEVLENNDEKKGEDINTNDDIVQKGEYVEVAYTGTFEDGTVFDASEEGQYLPFTVGGGQMISGFDNAVEGMKVGETKKVSLQPDEAYGEYDSNLIQTLNKNDFKGIMSLGYEIKEGEYIYGLGTITQVTDEGGTPSEDGSDEDFLPGTVTIDFNHPMAGKVLNFEITLMSIGNNNTQE